MVRPSKTRRDLSWGTKNTGKYGNMGIAPLGATQGFPLSSFFLSSARKIGSTQASASWTPVMPSAASAAAVARYIHYRRTPPLLPLPLFATADTSSRRRRRSLPPPPSTAAVDFRLRWLPPPRSAALAVTAGRYCRGPPFSLTAAIACHCLPSPAAPAAAVD